MLKESESKDLSRNFLNLEASLTSTTLGANMVRYSKDWAFKASVKHDQFPILCNFSWKTSSRIWLNQLKNLIKRGLVTPIGNRYWIGLFPAYFGLLICNNFIHKNHFKDKNFYLDRLKSESNESWCSSEALLRTKRKWIKTFEWYTANQVEITE